MNTTPTDTPRDAALRDACRALRIDTLESRHSDRLDCHTIDVWHLKAALEAMYEVGRRDADIQ